MQVLIAKNRRKWWLLGFAFLATVINYLNRQTLSVMAPVLLQQFRISATSYSQIVFAFMLAYTFMNGVSGRLLDRLGTRIGYGLTIAFWSGAEILNAFSAGALSLGIFQFLLGVGEAGNYPAGVKLITEWFPARRAFSCLGHLQQRRIHRGHSRSSIACVDYARQRMADGICSDRSAGVLMAGRVACSLPGAGRGRHQRSGGPPSAESRCCGQGFFGSSPCRRSLAIRFGIFTSSGSRNTLRLRTLSRCGRSAKRPGFPS